MLRPVRLRYGPRLRPDLRGNVQWADSTTGAGRAKTKRILRAKDAAEDTATGRAHEPKARHAAVRPSALDGARTGATTVMLPAVRPPISSGWASDGDEPGNRPNLGARPVESNGRMEESNKKVVTAAHEASSAAQRDAQPAPANQPDQPGQPDHRHVIAIDGAAAAGKTTVARELAARLKVTLFDTGVLYRTVTLEALRRSIPLDAADRLAELASNLDIRIGRPTVDDGRLYDVVVDGLDVTWAIRGADVDQHVSQVSAHGPVRRALLPVQRAIADGASVVMVGRDIGTVVTPAAGVKVFLSASLEERARRRHAELRARGKEVDLDFIVADLQRRDAIDSAREVSPLKAADDAILIDTDGRTVDEIVTEIEGLVRAAWSTLA
jgi:cytidylate kinase